MIRQRFVWALFPPGFDPSGDPKNKKNRPKIFGFEKSMLSFMEDKAPKYATAKKASPRGGLWTFGKTKGKQFVAKRYKIEDSDALPV